MHNENNHASNLLAANGDLTVRFKNKNSGLYLDETNSAGKGAEVIQFTSSSGNNQKWTLTYTESDDTFVIRSVSTPSGFLTVEGKSSTNGARILIGADEAPTKWKLQYEDETSAYRIVSQYGNYVKGIAVRDASKEPLAKTIIYDKTIVGTNDRWVIEFI